MFNFVANYKKFNKHNYKCNFIKKYTIFHVFVLIFAFFIVLSPQSINVCAASESVEEELGETINSELDNIDFSVLDEYLIGSEIQVDILPIYLRLAFCPTRQST